MDIHDIAAAIAGPAPSLRFRQGEITAVASSGGTISVKVAGSSTVVTGVRCLASVAPVVGDGVWLATDGADLFAIGTISPAGPPYCEIIRTNDGSLNTGTWYELSFASNTRTDPYGMWDSGDPDALTIPTPGVYSVDGSVEYDNNTTGRRDIALLLNGTTTFALDTRDGVDSVNTNCNVHATKALAAGDLVQLRARQSSGGTLSVVSSGGRISLTVCWLRPVTS